MKSHSYRAILAAAIMLPMLAGSPVEAQWAQTSGPYGGQVRALCAAGGGLFAGTNGGVYFSSNNGVSWSQCGLDGRSVMALAASGSVLYAGAGGVLRSTDNGLTWTDVGSGLGNTDVRSLCISGSYVFAGTAAGVYRAGTAGGNWTSVSSTALSTQMVFSLTVSGSYVVAGTWKGGIFRTNNSGSTWSQSNSGITNLSVRALYRSASSNHLYAGGEGGVHRSTNNGGIWTLMNSGLVTGSGSGVPIVQALAGTGSTVYAGTYNGGVLRSTNKASSWSPTTLALTTQALVVAGSNVHAGTFNMGVQYSTNSGSVWTQVNSGIAATNVLALESVGSTFLAGMSIPGTVAISTNGGGTWTNSGLANMTKALFTHGTDVFAGTIGGGLYKTTDVGLTWVKPGSPGTDVHALASLGSTLFAGVSSTCCLTQNGVHRSTDNGTTWAQVNTGLTFKKVYALAVKSTRLFAGTYDGGVFVSADNGSSWSASNSGLTDLNVIAFAVTNSHIYAGTWGGGVFVSADDGASWTEANTGVTGANANAFAVYGSHVFLGTEDGLFMTANSGAGWTDVSSGLGETTNIASLAIAGTTLYAGTLGGGVWKRVLSEMIPMPKQSASYFPKSVSLEQNFPNPFSSRNSATTIRYTIPAEGLVVLRVFDALGRRVTELVNRVLPAGSHDVVFHARGLPSGTYMYRIEYNGAVRTGMMRLTN